MKIKVDPYLQKLYKKVTILHSRRHESEELTQKYIDTWRQIKVFRRYGTKHKIEPI